MSESFAEAKRREADSACLQSAEEELRQLRTIIAAANVGLWDWDLRSGQVTYSSEWKRQIGYEDQEITSDFSEWESRVHPDDLEPTLRTVRSFVEKPWPRYQVEFRFRHRDGSYRWILAQASLVRDKQGRAVRMLGSHIDITDKKRSEEALAEREAQLSLCIDHFPAPVAMFDRDMRYLAASRRWCSEYGIDGSVLGRSHYEVFPELSERWKDVHGRCLAGAVERSEEEPFHRADGSVDWVRWEAHPWRTAHGDVGGIVIFSEIISERKRAEDALRESEARLRRVVDAVPHLIGILSPEGQIEYANQAWRTYFGGPADWTEPGERARLVHPDDRGAMVELRAGLRAGAGDLPASQAGPRLIRLRGGDGAYRWFSCQSALVDDAARPTYVIATATNVEELKRSEDSLREAHARLQASLRVGGIGTLVWEIRKNELLWDDSLLRLLGRGREEIATGGVGRLVGLVHPDDREAVKTALTEVLQSDRDHAVECRVLQADGKSIWLAAKGHVERDAAGHPVRLVAAAVDITHRKQLEAELLQSQKVEAIGQLATGVAHDFNNLLTVILGQASLLEAQPNLPTHVADALQTIEAAAKRAALLTGQLLAFGRRQVMKAHDLDLNEAVAETVKILRRLVGANVTFAFEPWRAPLFVRADPTMLTQVLLNLIVNARDAMEGGGHCGLRTSLARFDEASAAPIAGASAGSWACLSVSDTGTGIASEVLPHLFEPFFTTKGAGKGTGLGLSTVHSIARQHGGFVAVDTARGVGSTFRVFLPLGDAKALGKAVPVPTLPPQARRAKVLLVEDDLGVRVLAKVILESDVYQVTSAEDAAAARRIWWERGADFDLLLTDMAMPGDMTGIELAKMLRADKPSIKTILCSGHSLDVVGDEMGMGGLTLLQKPWTAEELRRTVRRALDGL